MAKIVYVAGIVVVLLFIIFAVTGKSTSKSGTATTPVTGGTTLPTSTTCSGVKRVLSDDELEQIGKGVTYPDEATSYKAILNGSISPCGVYAVDKTGHVTYTTGSGRWPSSIPANLMCPNSLPNHKCMYSVLKTAADDCIKDTTNCKSIWGRDGEWIDMKGTPIWQLNNTTSPTDTSIVDVPGNTIFLNFEPMDCKIQ